MNQKFGYTLPGPTGDECVKYVQVHQGESGLELHTRDEAGKITVFPLSKNVAFDLAASLI